MKNLILSFVLLFVLNNVYSQSVTSDTIKARDCLSKADKLSEEAKFDSALDFYDQAEVIYSKYDLNKAFLETELKKSLIYLRKNDLNKALEILNAGEQKVINLFGKNTDLYADFCDNKGMVYLSAKKYDDVKKMWIDALVIRKKIFGEEHYKVSVSYNNLGILYAETGEYMRSLKLFQKALTIREEVLPPNDLRTASELINTGNAYLKIDNPDFALKYFLKALAIKSKNSENFAPQLVSFYINIGDTYKLSERYDKALKYYGNGLSVIKHNSGENNPEAAQIFAKKALVLNLKGEYDKALDLNNKALEIFKNTYGEEHRTAAKVMRNIGTDYLGKDEITKAVEYFNNSLEIVKKVYGIWSLKTAEAYTETGKIMEDHAEYNAAESYFSNALKIQRNVYKTDKHPEIAESFIHIANAYKGDGDYYPALENYNKALAIREGISGNKHPKTARIYYLIAETYTAKRGYGDALKNLQKALIANVENFYSDNINFNPDLSSGSSFYYNEKLLFETLDAKAKAFSNIFLRTDNVEQLKKACEVYELADVVLNQIKNSASGKKDSIYVQKKMSSVCNDAAGNCMQLYKKTNENTYFNKAFVFSEKNKRSVLMSLPGADKFAGIPESVLKNETDLIVEKAYYRKKVSEDPSDPEIKQKLISLIKEQQSFINKSKTDYPKYYDFKYKPFAVTISDVQDAIDDSTVVFDYYSADEGKYVYVFKIEKTGTDIRFIKKTDDFKTGILRFREHVISKSQNIADEAFALYKELIPDIPENDSLIKQFVIIPDGILGTLPFEALLTEKYEGNLQDYQSYPFLMKKYAVSYAYSASYFDPKNIADTMCYSDTTYLNEWTGIVPVLGGGNNYTDSVYYEFSDHEKPAVLKIGTDADETYVKSLKPKNSRYIYFSAKTSINAVSPVRSGIQLAGYHKGRQSGLLTVNEIFDLNLSSNLIVLTASEESDINQFGRGASIVGFTRALFYGSAKNLIISLWHNNNQAAGELMFDFYKNILNENKNPQEFQFLLRSSKLKLIEDGSYAHPFYWSPFIEIKK